MNNDSSQPNDIYAGLYSINEGDKIKTRLEIERNNLDNLMQCLDRLNITLQRASQSSGRLFAIYLIFTAIIAVVALVAYLLPT